MKKLYVLIFSLLSFTLSYSQQVEISGKSPVTHIKLDPVYERGLPPNLFVDMSFMDENNNGILEARESSVLNLVITNKGKGKAQELKVRVIDNNPDRDLDIEDGIVIPYLMPDQSIKVTIPITAGIDIKTAEHKMEISVTEHFGYDMDPAFLILNTFEFLKPELVFSGLEIVDIGTGTAAIIKDAQIQPGEQVKVKIVVQNIGQNIAPNTIYHVSTSDNNIFILEGLGDIGTVDIGEVKEFWITLSPNKRITSNEKLPVSLTLRNDFDKGNLVNYRLPIQINQKSPQPEIVEVIPRPSFTSEQAARWEVESNRITVNVGNIIDINQAPTSETSRPNSIAIVIGVEEYEYFAPAPYADRDAAIMGKYFKNTLGIDDIYVYINDKVSGFFFDNIFDPDYGELQKAILKGQTDLFVFYSGHGMPSKDGEKVYLFPSDGRIEALEKQGYDLNKFYQNLQDLEAKSVTVFMDACFSGFSRKTEEYETKNLISMKGVAIKPNVLRPWEDNPNFIIFTSSGFNETSLGFDQVQYGLFTYYLCAGLQGNADEDYDNKITTGELSRYISKNVMETSTKILGVQTPLFFGDENKILSEF